MTTLARNLRKELENTVTKARRVAETGARKVLEQLAVHHHEPWGSMTPEQRVLRNRLRAHGRQLGDQRDTVRGTQSINRLMTECAYEQWHRMLFARFLAEADLLIEPESGMPLTLDECQELAREQGTDWLELASTYAERMLPQIFRSGDPVLEVGLPPETRSELEDLLKALPAEVFLADDSLGWVYQFWQTDRKEEVNKSGVKIGADELPAVTQLFTEDYMVYFLLHNTLGAWWAGKVLAQKPELATTATSEAELRTACSVGGIDWDYLRFVQADDGVWKPAAGTFDGWPKTVKEIKLLDPSMGSGHFLVFSLPILVAFRMAEESLSSEVAVESVLRDNIYGLEIDPRCTQIAAFNLAFAAWRITGFRILPQLHLACCGLSVSVAKEEWKQLALDKHNLRIALDWMYDVFKDAPELGSLLNPSKTDAAKLVSWEELSQTLEFALKQEAPEHSEKMEIGIVAQGLAKAATLLADKYNIIITNVPYLARGKQSEVLKGFSEKHYPAAKNDLATVFLDRCLELCADGGTTSVVLPQNWLFLTTYKKFREKLLRRNMWHLIARLGSGAFETISGEVVKAALITISNAFGNNDKEGGLFDTQQNASWIRAVDVSALRTASEKATGLITCNLNQVEQAKQLENPDARVALVEEEGCSLLSKYADGLVGLQTSDDPMFITAFWEFSAIDKAVWEYLQGTPTTLKEDAGSTWLVRWEEGKGLLLSLPTAYPTKGLKAMGKQGIAIHRMNVLYPYWYTKERFHQNVAVIIPHNSKHLPAIWCFCASPEYNEAVRRIDQKLNVTNATLVKVPFDIDYWSEIAADKFPDGLPKVYSNDPTQWLFQGHPKNSDTPLHVAVARLLCYRWPRQTGSSFPDCPVLDDDGLEKHVDDDGIVCLNPLKGEPPAAERLNALLADAYGEEWSAAKLSSLLTEVGYAGKSLDDWLRDGFFSQHCEIFHQRPFIWHIWDGRRDGFHALVNYHLLAAPDGEGRRTLDKLIYTYLGDWIDGQRRDQAAGVEGADAKLVAAEHLKSELEKIRNGEPPYDIFVRWKPLHQQPIGWEPDINDGVRLNIRPFMTAKPYGAKAANASILRTTPKNIKWDKDRGKEPERKKEEFPWFWGWDGQPGDFAGGREFDGNRWNDLHYTAECKRAARERQGN